MDEIWSVIEMFPNYMISNYGIVLNHDSGRHIKESTNPRGTVKVGLVKGGVQYTRSVRLLVAEAFVPKERDGFDTPINLDGDQHNNVAWNIMWRPRWFAWKYFREFTNPPPSRTRGPVIDIETLEVYDTFSDAGMANGVLTADVWRSIYLKQPTFPTNQMFELVGANVG